MLRVFISYFIILMLVNHAGRAQGGLFTLKGFIDGQRKGVITLDHINETGEFVKDTAVVSKGRFIITGLIKEPCMAYLRGNVRSQADSDSNAVGFYIEPSVMNITLVYDRFKQMKLIGSKNQRQYEGLKKEITAIKEDGNIYFEKMTAIISKFIRMHPSSYVSAFELLIMMQQLPIDTAILFYKQLSPAVQQSYYGKQIYPRLMQLSGSKPGRNAADFSTVGMNGEAIELSAFRGRYVLLDFWASWCVPCREGAPYLRSQFAKYHKQGLEIIGIADDDDHPDAWKKAVEKDSIGIWYNVLRGLEKNKMHSDWPVSINDKYDIGVLPTKILIDKNGVIVGRYQGTDQEPALYKKLSELFK